jgi:hypothetical protein
MVGVARTLYSHLLQTVSTPGELGTVANWNQHNLPLLLGKPGEELATLLGQELPADAQPDLRYRGPMRIIVPTRRTSMPGNETFKLKVIILSENPPRKAALYWRKLASGSFAPRPLRHESRGVYWAELPSPEIADFEYYLKVEAEGGAPVYFPPTAPKLNQTVVVCAPYGP